MKIHSNITQGTPEWFAIRAGKLTASNAQAIGNSGKGLDTLILETMSECFSTAKRENYTNDEIERGRELEYQARELYSLEKGVTVKQVGFVELDEYIGVSPDGLVENDGLVEFKCCNDKNHFKIILEGIKAVESKYVWQCQAQMKVCERSWNDLVFYNPNFSQPLIIFRLTPDPQKFAALEKGFAIGRAKIKEIREKMQRL